jgi:hypothetical protein
MDSVGDCSSPRPGEFTIRAVLPCSDNRLRSASPAPLPRKYLLTAITLHPPNRRNRPRSLAFLEK